MKAAYYERQGNAADVLVIGNLPDPEPSFGEVRVKVVFSGLNPTDIKARTGFAGRPMPFPRIVPHQDGAGIIDKVGVGVSESRIGAIVYGSTRRRLGSRSVRRLNMLPFRRLTPSRWPKMFHSKSELR